jgi:predicted dehydrogenase
MNNTTRREFLKTTGGLAGASALAGVPIPSVHPGENDTIQVALIGCGGRGTGAAVDALSVQSSPVRLAAMADVFPKRLNNSFESLQKEFRERIDLPEDRKFIGFDAYKHAIDCLKPSDVAIFATPPAFRWVHLRYAIQKGVNVFMEKPITVDGPSTRRMLELAEQVDAKNLKVGVGLMVRHCRGRRQLKERIEAGEIGEILTMRAYRMHGPVGSAFTHPKRDWDPEISELLNQIRRFHSFLWASGGCYSDFYIHQIDECSWMKGSWPIKAQANGGRHDRGEYIDQNFDTYTVEYTYADGSKFFYYGRTRDRCMNEFSSWAHGTKGAAVISDGGHHPGRVRIYKGQNPDPAAVTWAFPMPEPNPYRLEWEDLVEAIREDKPYNEVKRGAEASLVTSMGRMAAHTGHPVTYEQILKSDHEFAPDVDKLTNDSPAPLQAGPDGKYPVPEPGTKSKREY